jgi:hypothetical protein
MDESKIIDNYADMQESTVDNGVCLSTVEIKIKSLEKEVLALQTMSDKQRDVIYTLSEKVDAILEGFKGLSDMIDEHNN